MSGVPVLVTAGDPRHGVVRFSRELAAGVRARAPDPFPDAVHVQFTDRAWAATPEAAAERVIGLAAGRALTVTLHDIPQPSDGEASMTRRVAAYREVVRVSRATAVNSHHELALLHESGVLDDGDPPPEVIPLPVMAPPASRLPTPTATRREVALLGFVYPGKGHREAILAAAQLTPRLAVRALGGPAPGHGADVETLASVAAEWEVKFTVTGWLSEAELIAECRTAAIGLAAHTHLSASGSMNSWIACGRRPLVTDSRYAREMGALRPGTIRRYAPAELAAALDAALTTPGRTWLAPGARTRPHLDDVVTRYLDWWTRR